MKTVVGSQNRVWTFLVVVAAVPLASVFAQSARKAAAVTVPTWQSLANPGPIVYSCDVNLLTDGSLVDHGWRFTPDRNGNYVNGKWTPNAPLPEGYSPGAMARAVLADGRLIYEGGEVNNGVLNFTNLGAIYDPAANQWTPVAPPAGWTTIGGAPSVVLSDGRFMIGRDDEAGSRQQALLDPATLTWTTTGVGKADANQEEGWTLLPDGNVLAIDTNPPGTPTLSEIYNPRTGTWTSAGSTTVKLSDSEEMGPQVLRADGTVIIFGALASGVDHTAIYNTRSRAWSAGPDLPIVDGKPYTMNDGPAALLPNGNVFFAASPSPGHGQTTPTHFFEFDGTSFVPVADPSDAASLSNTLIQMLLLPTGQVFVTACGFSGLPRIYTPGGSPDPAWAPSIGSASSSVAAGATHTISGKQFNGLSQGAMYGDEGQQATNYPLVRITNSATGHVFYCRTHDHSTMGVATGSTPVSTQFDVPADIETGPSTIEVVANGIASRPLDLLVEASNGSNAAPNITPGGVVPVGGAGATIESGQWVSIYGTNLASSVASWSGDFPTSLKGVSVTINGKPAYISYVSPTQVDVQAPADSTIGTVPVLLKAPNGTASSTVKLAPFAPSLFSLDSTHIAGIILRADHLGAYAEGTYDILGPTGSSLGYPTMAAKPGDLIEVFGGGLGETSPSVPPGRPFSGAAQTIAPVALRLDNVLVTPTFAGLSGAGAYQINFQLPAGLPSGDLPLTLTVGGVATPPGMVISVQEGHP